MVLRACNYKEDSFGEWFLGSRHSNAPHHLPILLRLRKSALELGRLRIRGRDMFFYNFFFRPNPSKSHIADARSSGFKSFQVLCRHSFMLEVMGNLNREMSNDMPKQNFEKPQQQIVDARSSEFKSIQVLCIHSFMLYVVGILNREMSNDILLQLTCQNTISKSHIRK